MMEDPSHRRLRLRLDLKMATMRLNWAILEARRSPGSPALSRFIKDSRQECRTLKDRLAKIEKSIQREKLSRELKI